MRDPDSKGTSASISEMEAQLAGMRILLADDGEANRTLIIRFLKHTQAKIDAAADGATAIEMFKAGDYDLILMDIEMPITDGYAATREIRRLESAAGAPPLPVIGLTAHSLDEISAKVTDVGFTGILTKPIPKSALLEVLVQHRSAAPIAFAPAGPGGWETDIADLIPQYLERRREDLSIYRKAVETEDFDTISRLAHNMKGTGSGYGLPEITGIGQDLHDAAKRADTPAVREIVERFAKYLENLSA